MIQTKCFQRFISKIIKNVIKNISLPNQNLIYLINNYRQIQGEDNIPDWKTLLAEQFQGQMNLENLISQVEDQMKVQVQESKRIQKEKKLLSKQQKQEPFNNIQQYLSQKSLVQCNGFPINQPYCENEIQNYDQLTELQQQLLEKEQLKSEQKLFDQQKIISEVKIEKCDKCDQIKESQELLKINHFYCCSQCCLDSLNPLSKISRKLKTIRYITESDDNEKKYTLDEFDIQSDDQLEIRCIQISQKGMSEMTFPQNCVLRLNGCVLKYFQPLSVFDSVNKRVDKPVIINKQFFKKYLDSAKQFDFSIQYLKLNDKKVRQDQPRIIYEFSLYITKKQQKEDIIQNAINQENAQQIIQEQQELSIVQTKVSLVCCFTNQIMKIPAKGAFCIHKQCFCLENFINMQISSKNYQKWLCPICKQPLIDIQIDQNQFQALKLIRKYIQPDGEIDLNFVNIYQNKLLQDDLTDLSNEMESSGISEKEYITID